jgi:coenzyme F420-reducing hydrogenase delta subunit
MRLQYPPNIRIIRVPCTGRVDQLYLFEALENGADGVFLSG